MTVLIRRPARAARCCAVCALLAAAAVASPVRAQLRPPDAATVADSSTRAYERADRRMMDAMQGARYTGDADRDFVSHMAPHHQGAVDMAQVELKYGKDPTLRQLATRIVAAQRDEIALMTRWQKTHGATP
ncbi:CopM family metallochaperone [Burkholderia anthina]|uniref:CopM family metallochaperone n=1 Tax=Burkholderia anthina TaxID=179879 RepID=UPI001AA042F4|nr:DUF305 domain-containing protein [Burkholderia anthina]QTD94445.1 DUF305 domain-containing protein [Burkholderia anthina]